VAELRAVLAEAIRAGGSTISDFRQAGGGSGYFQHRFRVYGRAGEPCTACGAALSAGVVGGRGTCWCRSCQR
jgi:formamidopyrimidine-DNA glycosylase